MAARDTSAGILRIEPHRLVEINEGAREVAFVAPDQAAMAIGKGAPRNEADRRAEVGDGSVELPLGAPGKPAAGIGGCHAGIDANDGGLIRDGALEVAVLLANERADVVQNAASRAARKRLGEIGVGADKVARGIAGQTSAGEGVGE